MIIETIVSTCGDTEINFAPMGCIFRNGKEAELRPFCSSNTYSNLKRKKRGIVNVTSDINAFVDTALKLANPEYDMTSYGGILKNCFKYYLFDVKTISVVSNRAEVEIEFVDEGYKEKYWQGFNRAQFAVLESLILATRINLYEYNTVRYKLREFKSIVVKTGSEEEISAFKKVFHYIKSKG